MAKEKREIMEVSNVLHPGKVYRVDAEKYEAMRKAFLTILPAEAPGLSAAEIIEQVKPHLPAELFPGGEKAGWWVAAVQLDLEAKGIIKREGKGPVRLYRVG
ncbi:MAG: hypothetical protein LCI00_30740 [Chloroflexi bacterium]|nr:hypothetical protein [Chloroflexota bacterium]MCC6894771.1 hypothetical protein [Anaerolineae bacterium]